MTDSRRQVTPDRLVGERVGGRFVIERLIGHGPLSSAFRARDERLHRRVTVKLFHPQHPDDAVVVEQQLVQAKAVARLSHENIVTVIDRGTHEGLALIVLEYVRGENLEERIERYAPLRVQEVVDHGVALARALTYAHGEGVVHGNVRPANVLVSEERDVKLVDFGGGSWVASLTGSDAYMRPELRHAGRIIEAEPADDIYALGILLIAALTEELPESGIDARWIQLLRPDVSPHLAHALATAVAGDPESRYGEMREFAAELTGARVALLGHAGGDGRRRSRDPRAGVSLEADAQATGLLPMMPPDAEDGSGESTEPFTLAAASVQQRRRRRSPRMRRRASRADDARFDPARSRRAGRARLLAWSMIVVPLLALLLIGMMIAGERSADNRHSNETVMPAPSDGVEVPIDQVGTFDPYATDGIHEEHPETIANIHDGDPTTTWQTEGYGDASLGGKPGVGFWVQTAEPETLQRMVMATDLPGWRLQVFASDTVPDKLEGWTAVSETMSARANRSLRIDTGGKQYTHWLVWITRLALDTSDTDNFRARLSELRLFATPK